MSTQCLPFLRPRPARGTAVASSRAFLTEAGYEAVDVHLTCNICTRPHRELFDALHRTLGDNPPVLKFGGHRYLSMKDAEDGTPPARTIKLHLAGCSDENRATLALSDGDAGVMAFADGAGLWHAFPLQALFGLREDSFRVGTIKDWYLFRIGD